MTSGMIRTLDSIACQMLEGKRGRPTHVMFFPLSGEFPSCRPATAHIVAWAETCFFVAAPRKDLDNAWRTALVSVSRAKDPATAVKGTPGTASAAALRFGWRMPGWHTFCEARGLLLEPVRGGTCHRHQGYHDGFHGFRALVCEQLLGG